VLTISGVTFTVERDGRPARLVVQGAIYGVAAAVSAEDLTRLSRWAASEAARLEAEEAERSTQAQKEG
jgi:hypothetical protein